MPAEYVTDDLGANLISFVSIGTNNKISDCVPTKMLAFINVQDMH